MGEFWLLLALEVNRALPTYLPFSLKRNQNHTASQRQKMNCQQLLSATSKPQIYSLWKENRLMKKYWFCDFCVFYNGIKINTFSSKTSSRRNWPLAVKFSSIDSIISFSYTIPSWSQYNFLIVWFFLSSHHFLRVTWFHHIHKPNDSHPWFLLGAPKGI